MSLRLGEGRKERERGKEERHCFDSIERPSGKTHEA